MLQFLCRMLKKLTLPIVSHYANSKRIKNNGFLILSKGTGREHHTEIKACVRYFLSNFYFFTKL